MFSLVVLWLAGGLHSHAVGFITQADVGNLRPPSADQYTGEDHTQDQEGCESGGDSSNDSEVGLELVFEKLITSGTIVTQRQFWFEHGLVVSAVIVVTAAVRNTLVWDFTAGPICVVVKSTALQLFLHEVNLVGHGLLSRSVVL